MILENNKQLDVFMEILKQFPDKQFDKLIDYAEYLIFKERKLLERIMPEDYLPNNSKNEVNELEMPVYKCEGMENTFNRDDLYYDRI